MYFFCIPCCFDKQVDQFTYYLLAIFTDEMQLTPPNKAQRTEASGEQQNTAMDTSNSPPKTRAQQQRDEFLKTAQTGNKAIPGILLLVLPSTRDSQSSVAVFNQNIYCPNHKHNQ